LKVTLESTESLQDALRVVGALYGVQLVVAGDSPDSDDQPATRQSTPKSSGRRGRRPAATETPAATASSATKASSATTSELRAWAKANGVDVNERGPVPASVRDAYAAAN